MPKAATPTGTSQPRIINDGAEMVDVRRLQPHERNVNQGDYGAIQESIKANGWWGRLIVQRSSCRILVGNHRFKVACELGFTQLPVEWVDCSDEEALRIVLADNRTARLGYDDPAGLAALLSELAATPLGLGGTGYDGDFLDDLIAEVGGTSDGSAVNGDLNTDAQETPLIFSILVTCESESEQARLLEEFLDDGLNVRAFNN